MSNKKPSLMKQTVLEDAISVDSGAARGVEAVGEIEL